MKFKELKLYTDKLDQEKKFYSDTLGFSLIRESANSFSVQVGWSVLSFEKSKKQHSYHYCFLIPANKLNEALVWMEKRVPVIAIEADRKTQNFESWNADSFYFCDASRNIAEFIVRHDLKNNDHADFDSSRVLGISEMGMPVTDISTINEQLETELDTKFWKGDFERFGTNGSQEGIFLLPNYKVKDTWFPTSAKIVPEPFEAVVENAGKEFKVEFGEELLKISAQS